MQGKRAFSLLIRYGLTAVALGYAAWRIWKDRDTFGQSLDRLADAQWHLVLLSLLLVVANVGTETWKWKLLVQPLYPDLRWGRAVRAVLAGMSTGLVTPNRVGEYAGRVLHLAPGKRWEAVSMTFMDRLCQMLVTLVMGAVGLSLGAGLLEMPTHLAVLLAGVPAVCVLAFLLLSNRIGRAAWVPRLRWAWLQKLLMPLAQTRPLLLLRVMGLSLVRYVVFSSQYILLLMAFSQAPVTLESMALFVLLVFLGKSVLPVVSGLGELGVRESLALTYAPLLGIADPAALQATFLLFVFNILLPAVVGIPFVQGMRIGKEDA